MARMASLEARSLASRRAIDPGGFSLLELTIVLAIMGLLGALAMPSLTRMSERTTFSLNRQDVERQLDQLPQRAAAMGRNLVLTSTLVTDGETPVAGLDPYPIKLPDGWGIVVERPIRYRYDGSCSGGKLQVTAPSVQANYILNPPLCELRPG